MKINYDEMNDQNEQNIFKDVDVSNWYELAASLLLSVVGNILLYMIFQRIQNLFLWKMEDQKNNLSKMLTVNCLLLLTILFKIFSLYYQIAGFYFSRFWKWDCQTTQQLTISPSFYIIIQICEAQTLNFTFCYCSNLWLKLWRMKLKIDQNISLLKLTKILQVLLTALIVSIPILTIVSLILETYIIVLRRFNYTILQIILLYFIVKSNNLQHLSVRNEFIKKLYLQYQYYIQVLNKNK